MVSDIRLCDQMDKWTNEHPLMIDQHKQIFYNDEYQQACEQRLQFS